VESAQKRDVHDFWNSIIRTFTDALPSPPSIPEIAASPPSGAPLVPQHTQASQTRGPAEPAELRPLTFLAGVRPPAALLPVGGLELAAWLLPHVTTHVVGSITGPSLAHTIHELTRTLEADDAGDTKPHAGVNAGAVAAITLGMVGAFIARTHPSDASVDGDTPEVLAEVIRTLFHVAHEPSGQRGVLGGIVIALQAIVAAHPPAMRTLTAYVSALSAPSQGDLAVLHALATHHRQSDVPLAVAEVLLLRLMHVLRQSRDEHVVSTALSLLCELCRDAEEKVSVGVVLELLELCHSPPSPSFHLMCVATLMRLVSCWPDSHPLLEHLTAVARKDLASPAVSVRRRALTALSLTARASDTDGADGDEPAAHSDAVAACVLQLLCDPHRDVANAAAATLFSDTAAAADAPPAAALSAPVADAALLVAADADGLTEPFSADFVTLLPSTTTLAFARLSAAVGPNLLHSTAFPLPLLLPVPSPAVSTPSIAPPRRNPAQLPHIRKRYAALHPDAFAAVLAIVASTLRDAQPSPAALHYVSLAHVLLGLRPADPAPVVDGLLALLSACTATVARARERISNALVDSLDALPAEAVLDAVLAVPPHTHAIRDNAALTETLAAGVGVAEAVLKVIATAGAVIGPALCAQALTTIATLLSDPHRGLRRGAVTAITQLITVAVTASTGASVEPGQISLKQGILKDKPLPLSMGAWTAVGTALADVMAQVCGPRIHQRQLGFDGCLLVGLAALPCADGWDHLVDEALTAARDGAVDARVHAAMLAQLSSLVQSGWRGACADPVLAAVMQHAWELDEDEDEAARMTLPALVQDLQRLQHHYQR
jgi:hypothetical protein